MFRRFAMTVIAMSLMVASLPLAHAQFADDTQSLFSGDPDAPKTKNDVMTFDLGTPDDDEVNTGAAQTVEELCCALTEDERRTDGLCFDVQCPSSE